MMHEKQMFNAVVTYYYYSITISITNISTNGFDARHHDYISHRLILCET